MDEPDLDAQRLAGRAEDTRLVLAVRAGDAQAFGQLYDRWFDRVYDLASRIVRNPDLAAEVAQDSFLKAWRSLEGLENPDAFGGWLLRIARNSAYNHSQKEGRSHAVDDQGLAMIESVGASPTSAPAGFGVEDRLGRAATPEAAVEDREAASLVWQAAAALPARDIEVLDLQLRHGLTPAEIGEVMGMNRNSANQLVHRLRGRLETAIRARVLWRGGEPACAVLAARLRDAGIVSFGAEAVRVVERHVPGCSECDERQRLKLQPAALFAATPLMVAPLLVKQQAAQVLAVAGVPMQGSAFTGAHIAGSVVQAGQGAAPDGSSIADQVVHVNPDGSSIADQVVHVNPDGSSIADQVVRSNPDASNLADQVLTANPDVSNVAGQVLQAGAPAPGSAVGGATVRPISPVGSAVARSTNRGLRNGLLAAAAVIVVFVAFFGFAARTQDDGAQTQLSASGSAPATTTTVAVSPGIATSAPSTVAGGDPSVVPPPTASPGPSVPGQPTVPPPTTRAGQPATTTTTAKPTTTTTPAVDATISVTPPALMSPWSMTPTRSSSPPVLGWNVSTKASVTVAIEGPEGANPKKLLSTDSTGQQALCPGQRIPAAAGQSCEAKVGTYTYTLTVFSSDGRVLVTKTATLTVLEPPVID